VVPGHGQGCRELAGSRSHRLTPNGRFAGLPSWTPPRYVRPMALKRITDIVETRQLGHLKLWFEDIKALVKVLDEVSPVEMIVIDGDYRVDTVDDLRQYEAIKVDSIVVTTAEERFRLTLDGRQAELRVKDPDPISRAMSLEIERLAAARKRRVYTRRGWISFAIGTIVVLTVYGVLIPWWDMTDDLIGLSLLGLWTLLLIGLVGGAAQAFGFQKSSAAMFSRTREESPPWLKRNKDALVTNTIVSLVFLIIGIAVGKLTS
jgi:hypothetical protein